MRQIIMIAALISITAAPAFAQKIKVRKVKGNSAIVESTGPLQPGAVYDLMSADDFGEEIGSTPRKYLVGLNFVFTNTKSDAANTTAETYLNLSAKFGWNLGTFELGPLIDYRMNHVNDVTQTTWKVGGWADYNFTPNMAGESFLFGLGATGAFGNEDRGNGTKVDLFNVFVGPFAKWFPTSSSVGFRMDFGYVYERQSVTDGYTTASGLASSAGIFAYF
ncbi:MAG: hypothetical protein J7501_08720 [Bdellovibrio sp.]|nr:hypothetical protein [Bdellovibrio sp.]